MEAEALTVCRKILVAGGIGGGARGLRDIALLGALCRGVWRDASLIERLIEFPKVLQSFRETMRRIRPVHARRNFTHDCIGRALIADCPKTI